MIRKSLIYAASGIFGKIFSVGAGIALRHLIPPAQFGLWNLTQVIVGFVSKFDLGCDGAVARDLALEVGRRDPDAILTVQTAAWSIVAAQGVAYTLAVLGYWQLAARSSGQTPAVVWVGAATMLLVFPLTMTWQTVIQTRGWFEHAGYLGVVISVVGPLCWLIGGLMGGAPGLILGGAIGAVASAGVVGRYAWLLGVRIAAARASWTAVRRLLRYGVPMRLFDYPSTVYFSSDIFVVAALFDRQSLALYGTAVLAVSVTSEIASRLVAAERNEWRIRLGADPADQSIPRGSFGVLHMMVLAVWPILAWGIYLATQVATFVFMPMYLGALPVLKILLVAWIFSPATYGVRDFWLVRGNFGPLLLTGVVGLAAFGAILTPLYWFTGSRGPEIVALAFLASGAVYMALLLGLLSRGVWSRRQVLVAAALLSASALLLWESLDLAVLSAAWGQTRDLMVVVRAAGKSALALLPLLILWLFQVPQRLVGIEHGSVGLLPRTR